MVRAILDGRKTQTRRVIRWPWPKLPPEKDLERLADDLKDMLKEGCDQQLVYEDFGNERKNQYGEWHITCPGFVGCIWWVRETYTMAQRIMSLAYTPSYRADEGVTENNTMPDGKFPWKWTPAIHMRREHSRITLEVTGVRVERVREISEEDAKAEGITAPMYPSNGEPTYRFAYRYLWNDLNAKRGFGWEKNPWVWVLEFKRI